MDVINVVRKYLIQDLTGVIKNYYIQEKDGSIGNFGCWKKPKDIYFASEMASLRNHFELLKYYHHIENLDNATDIFLRACGLANSKKIIKYAYRKLLKHYSPNPIPTRILNVGLDNAGYTGRIDFIKLLIRMGANDYSYGLRGALESGQMEAVDFFIRKGANDWNRGLWGACGGGHLKCVKLMIEKGANDWKEGLCWACDLGHMEIVKYATTLNLSEHIWMLGLKTACKSNQTEIVKFIINEGKCHDINTRGLFSFACASGNIEIVQFFIEKGANRWREGLQGAYMRKRKNITKMLLTNYPIELTSGNIYRICELGDESLIEILGEYELFNHHIQNRKYTTLYSISRSGNVELFEAMFDRMYSMETKREQEEALISSLEHVQNLEMAKRIYEMILQYVPNYLEHRIGNKVNIALHDACRLKNYKLVSFLVEHATNFEQGLIGAVLGNSIYLVKLMISLGATNFDKALVRTAKGHYDIRKYLVEQGANPSNLELYDACRVKNFERVQELFESERPPTYWKSIDYPIQFTSSEIRDYLALQEEKIEDELD